MNFSVEENIIIRTNNVAIIKGNYVLLVDNNKVVYLKDFQIKSFSNFYEQIEGYLVSLNKKYFKVYEFKNIINDEFAFEKEVGFDNLYKIAESQNGNMDVKVKTPELFQSGIHF